MGAPSSCGGENQVDTYFKRGRVESIFGEGLTKKRTEDVADARQSPWGNDDAPGAILLPAPSHLRRLPARLRPRLAPGLQRLSGALTKRQPRLPNLADHVLAGPEQGRPAQGLHSVSNIFSLPRLPLLSLLTSLKDGEEGVHSLLRTSGGGHEQHQPAAESGRVHPAAGEDQEGAGHGSLPGQWTHFALPIILGTTSQPADLQPASSRPFLP